MPNRTVCEVLGEIRDANKNRNYSYLESLIEEVQMMANRMESALYDQSDLRSAAKKLKELKAEKIKLKEEIQNLKDKKKEKE